MIWMASGGWVRTLKNAQFICAMNMIWKWVRHMNECEKNDDDDDDGLCSSSSRHFIMVSNMRIHSRMLPIACIFHWLLKCVSCAFISRLSCVRVSKHVVYKHATHSTARFRTPLHTGANRRESSQTPAHTTQTLTQCVLKLRPNKWQQQNNNEKKPSEMPESLKEFSCVMRDTQMVSILWVNATTLANEFRSNRTLQRLNNEWIRQP